MSKASTGSFQLGGVGEGTAIHKKLGEFFSRSSGDGQETQGSKDNVQPVNCKRNKEAPLYDPPNSPGSCCDLLMFFYSHTFLANCNLLKPGFPPFLMLLKNFYLPFCSLQSPINGTTAPLVTRRFFPPPFTTLHNTDGYPFKQVVSLFGYSCNSPLTLSPPPPHLSSSPPIL